MANKSSTYNSQIKSKRLQRMSDSLAVIIPESWIRTFEWTQNTPLVMSINCLDRKIEIREAPIGFENKPARKKRNEDTNQFASGISGEVEEYSQ
jgi:hypothetical protein